MTLTKSYVFSASYSSGPRVIAHNYRLKASFDGLEEGAEPELDKKIQSVLIQKIHSHDLGQDVDFLRGRPLSDTSLLDAFWPLFTQIALPARLISLSLERDANTRWTLMAPR